jgi:transposase
MPVTREGMERAMRVQEVIVRGLSGALTWLQVADILGRSPRSIRRMRWRFEQYGYDGLYDGRRAKPSPKRAPVAEVERILRLYRERYPGFNGRHFYQVARREHAVTLSYTFVKTLLQRAGLLASGRARGRHRRRREPRPCFGELLHLDGSLHPWLALDSERKQTLITVVDDATKQLLYGQFAAGGESVVAVMTALRAVLERHGLPMALYTDRARWAAYTPTSGTNPDRSKLTQVGRALQRLGIEHILGYSPQARGRSERVNRTLQDRLVNELRVAEIRTPAGANRYLRERFLPAFNIEFARAPTDPTAAFVPLGRTDLDQILCHEEERVVALDNTVRLDGVVLQLAKQRGRRSCAGLRVLLRRHLDGRHSVWWGTRCLGQYASSGHPWPAATRTSIPPLRAAN